jgi:hypothetical protein
MNEFDAVRARPESETLRALFEGVQRPSNAAFVSNELRTKAFLESPLLGPDLEQVDVQHKRRDERDGEGVGQEGSPSRQNQQEPQVHRVAGHSVHAGNHQRRRGLRFHGIHRGLCALEGGDAQNGDERSQHRQAPGGDESARKGESAMSAPVRIPTATGGTFRSRPCLRCSVIGSPWKLFPYRSSANLRSRRAFPMTDTELKLIAAAAIIGLRSIPAIG